MVVAEYQHFPIYDFLCIYGVQIVLISFLSVITLFRREFSCNSCYGEKKAETSPRSSALGKNLQPQTECNIYESKPCPPTEVSYDVLSCYGEKRVETITRPPALGKNLQHKTGCNISGSESCPLSEVPYDVQVAFLSYLHPRDIISFSCAEKRLHEIIHNDDGDKCLSNVLWFNLWVRDYAWVLTQWNHGMRAVNQSHPMEWNCPDLIRKFLGKVNEGIKNIPSRIESPTMKEFYLVFSQTWLTYCIAGRSQNPTLVGIHGHVFDMSSFLEDHPGSPETLIIEGGGKDSSDFFESVGHSNVARLFAMDKLVEVVDLSCCGNIQMMHGLRRSVDGIRDLLPLKRSQTRTPGTLLRLKRRLSREKRLMKVMAKSAATSETRGISEEAILGSVNVFFDPLCYNWKAWYLNSVTFEPVFINHISDGNNEN